MMDRLLEKILHINEVLHTGEWGFVNPSGKRIIDIKDHESHAMWYLKQHNQSVPKAGGEVTIAKFLSLSRWVRYYIENEEVGVTVVAPVTSLQVSALAKIGRRDREVLFDIQDERGDILYSGEKISNLISTLKKMDLLEKILHDDEDFEETDWGFVDPSGKKITNIVSHIVYAKTYFKKHNISLPRIYSSVEAIAKFLSLTKYIRYTVSPAEIDFTIVTSVSPAQVSALQALSKGKSIIYDIVDEQGDTIEYGVKFSNLISSLKNMDLLEKILKESSIDFPRQDLDDAIWDKEDDTYTLKNEVKEKILAILEEYPDVPLLEIAEEIRIVGSLCTNQFLDGADCDAHIIPKNINEWSEEEVNKVIRWFNENRDEVDGWIDGHPLEVYIQLDPNQDLMSDGCYNLLEDEWLVGPKVVPMSSDPYEDFSHIADDIRSTVEDADKLFGELKRDVIDFEVIKIAMERMSGEDKDRLLAKLQDKLDELETDIEALYKEKGEWTDARRGASKPETPEQALKDVELAKNWGDVNATFKFVNRYRYMRVIKNLKDLLADEEITPDEVDKIKSIMGV